MQPSPPKVKTLVLDAGPLLSLTPLRGLAQRYLTPPQVLDELKDKRAREHFERLALTAGVRVEVRKPNSVSLAKVITCAKKTGDYSVLSHADLCVIALTCAIDEEEKQGAIGEITGQSNASQEMASEDKDLSESTEHITEGPDSTHLDETSVDRTLEPIDSPSDAEEESESEPTQFEDPPSEDDDGEGEWITPANVALHKSRALELLPADSSTHAKKAQEPLVVGCMTADFAMQNVLLQMNLNLVSVDGKRIERVKTWVLRCHACFKICKDPTKKFCPSCGNPTLIRTSVTASAPSATDASPALQVHLKKNFQWRNRGTIYSIPAPKPGSSKTGRGEGLILREDQPDWIRAEKRAEGRRTREEKKMIKALAAGEGSVRLDWMDPDWMPEMLTVGAGGKGRSNGKEDMPPVGYGRKNPNERRRKK